MQIDKFYPDEDCRCMPAKCLQEFRSIKRMAEYLARKCPKCAGYFGVIMTELSTDPAQGISLDLLEKPF